MNNSAFYPADILIPRDADLTSWAVVACDQYTSEPDYWSAVAERVGSRPSALHITLPEIYLEDPDVSQRIDSIRSSMKQYLAGNLFDEFPGSVIYLERTLADGKIRRGIVGAVDLESYDYSPGANSLIRATEKTVLERIPPRVRVRKDALLELPHVMLLLDDPAKTVIEPLAAHKSSFRMLYDFPLMQNSGHLRGWQVSDAEAARISCALGKLTERFSKDPLLFAVGDGNHSLATAKECYEQLKKVLTPEQAAAHPARYALVEAGNLHDETLEFEPIHRVMFDLDPDALLAALSEQFAGRSGGKSFRFISAGHDEIIETGLSLTGEVVGAVQDFLDRYLELFGGRIDYIHGDGVVAELAAVPNCAGILLPPLEKEELFPSIMANGVFPRKTFSMGHACDKRFYLECRKIR